MIKENAAFLREGGVFCVREPLKCPSPADLASLPPGLAKHLSRFREQTVS